MSIKNDYDTEVTAINGIAVCDNCRDERDDILEVDYVEYSYGPEVMTAQGRTTDNVCYECFQEYY